MIIIEQYENNANLERRYSDKGVYMRQVETGIEYAEAVDVVPCRYTYVETEHPIEVASEEDERADMASALNLLGVRVDGQMA